MFSGPDKRQKILTLATMCFALFMAMLDNTVVNVALPTIQKHLGAGFSELQWIVDGYVLAFASLLLTGGIIGDRYGRKKAFMMGLAVFTASSLACGLSGNTSQLIAFRVLQGVGAALLMPGTLSIITVTFPPQERAKAIGIWAGVSGLALAGGPTLGGLMVEHLGWQSVFFLNVPIGITGFVVAASVLKESRSEIERQLDIPGLILGTTALFSAVYALIEVNEKGWSDPLIIGCLAAAGLLLIAFLTWERNSEHAMIPLRFFRIPAFAAGNTVAFSVSLGMFAIFFFLSLYMQDIRGYDPVQAGLWFLPMTLMIIVTAPNAGRIASKIGSRYPMTIGLLMAGGGLMTLSFVLGLTTNFWLMVPILMVMGSGMGMTMTPMTAAVMNAVGPQRAGMGSAMTNTSREVGGVFGIALLGTVLSTALSGSISKLLPTIPGLTAAQRAGIAVAGHHGQLDPAVFQKLGVSPIQIPAILHSYGLAYIHGFHYAMRTGATVLLFAAVIAYSFVPHGAPKADGHLPGRSREPEDLEPVSS